MATEQTIRQDLPIRISLVPPYHSIVKIVHNIQDATVR